MKTLLLTLTLILAACLFEPECTRDHRVPDGLGADTTQVDTLAHPLQFLCPER